MLLVAFSHADLAGGVASLRNALLCLGESGGRQNQQNAAFDDRLLPASVLGPVDSPPWSLQRPAAANARRLTWRAGLAGIGTAFGLASFAPGDPARFTLEAISSRLFCLLD